jgi:hypothetical protein
MKLSIKRFFEENGVILEMKDWKSHFLAGTKGMPRTEATILDYVEDLLRNVYDDAEKVKNNRLAPWLVKQVSQIGVGNIGTSEREKMLTIIEWVKEVGGEGNIPKMNLNQAFDFSAQALEKRGKLKKQAEKKDDKPAVGIPQTKDEKEGKILRVGVVNDGSNRMWVKVLKDKWNKEQCELGRTKGVQCQATHNFIGGGYDQYTLVGPPKGDPNGPISTILSMNVWPATKAITELKQESNQQPGAQATSGGWKDADKQVIDFIAFNPVGRENILRFHNYQANEQEPDLHPDSARMPYGGGAGAIWYIMDKNPELFNQLVVARPEIRDVNRNIILSHHKFGKKWFELFGVDIVEYAKENPERFIQNIENYEFAGPKKIEEALNGINIDAIAKKNPKLILSKIEKLLNNLSVETFRKLISTIGISKYMSENPERFQELMKMMATSKNQQYKDVLRDMIDSNIDDIVGMFGGGIKGLYGFLDFLSMPRMHKFSKKGQDGQIYAFRTVRDEQTGEPKIVEFAMKDDLSVMPQKDRRKIIDKNKEWVKSNFTGTDEEKEIKYLRVLFKEINPQDVERTVKGEKEKFVNYYDKNPSKVTGFPGILEFYSVINRGKPGYAFAFATLGGKEKTYYKMDLEEFKNKETLKNLLMYYYKKSDKTALDEKKYEAAEDLLKTMEFSGESPENITDFARREFSPKNVSGKNLTSTNYAMFFAMMSKFIGREDLLKLIKSYEKDIVSSGITGPDYYKHLLARYSDKAYNVKKGDMVLFLGVDFTKMDPNKIEKAMDKMNKVYLTKDMLYKVTNVSEDEGGSIKHSKIEVVDDRKKKAWYPTSFFKIKIIDLNESVRKYVIKKLLEASLIKEQKIGSPIYSAVVLDTKSKEKILEVINVPEGWDKIAHHMTINMGALADKELIGKKFDMRVIGVASDDKVIAVKVETDAPSKNQIKHVTVAVNRDAGGKPVMSNFLTGWEKVKTPFFISGTVEEVY